MPSESLLQIVGSRGDKQPRYAPIFTDRFFVGLWTNRNPLRSPLSTFYADGWHLGGTDALIGGVNVELSPRLTLCRRPGNAAYSTATIATPPTTFYPFKLFGSGIDVIVDTAGSIYNLTPTAATSIFTKAVGAGQSNFLGIGQTLYFGDGSEQRAWQNGTIRNWGIAPATASSPVGPNLTGAGANSGSGVAWTNPNNVTSAVSYATISLTSGQASQKLQATTFAFSLPATDIITGIQVTCDLNGTHGGTVVPNIFAQLLKGGVATGNISTQFVTPSTSGGGGGSQTDLWGTSWTYNDINQTGFGVQFFSSNELETRAFNIRNVNITVYFQSGPPISLVSGTLTATTGYKYVYCYGNSLSGHVGNPTSPSANTGAFQGGAISTSALTYGGYGYAANDTGTIVTSKGVAATYKILTVGAGGVVATYSITSPGSGYAVGYYQGATGGGQAGTGIGFYINVTAVTGGNGVQVSLLASTDSQVNQIWVFRTADGGSTFLALPTSPYPNSTGNITDNALDTQLNILLQASVNLVNSAPPNGAVDPLLYLGLVWVHVGNTVYFSRTASAVMGNTYESFPPANVFAFPETVIRKVPINAGLLIFTTSNMYLIAGQNTSSSILFSVPFLSGYGILSWNAVWLDGSIIYFFTSDNRLIRLDPSSGVEDMGFPIGDQLASFNPANVYVTHHTSTSNDAAVYIGDGSTGWFRCNPNQAPDGAITGPVWSPKANVVGGCGALVGMETSPGVHQLMMGGTGNSQPVLVRDSSYTTFTDNGTAYPANYIIGSVVLAQPGQVAILRFVTTDLVRVGTTPVVGVLLGEISGSFETISGYVVNDPPYLAASSSLFNNRYYFKQSVGGNPPAPALCRHLQIKVDYGATDTVQNELLSITLNGAHYSEK